MILVYMISRDSMTSVMGILGQCYHRDGILCMHDKTEHQMESAFHGLGQRKPCLGEGSRYWERCARKKPNEQGLVPHRDFI